MGVILHIIVVGFHHAHGPIVEYAFPPFPGQEPQAHLKRLDVPEEWSLLPFLALPDGSHQSDEDFTYFHLPPVKNRKDVATTLFGISCNRQILTKDLIVKTDDVTRSSVQKAVVVLATQPIFGVLRQRLAVVTAAWFGQKDFTQTEILAQFYDSLNATVSDSIPDSAFLMGTSLRELVTKFKYKVLVLLKLLLLEKRVIFFGYPVETLCTYQYSLMSLVPGLLKSLQDAGSPLLDSEAVYMRSMSKTPAHSTDKQELFKYLGLPLHIFGEGSFFQPYLPLQQIDILQDPRTRSYIIGTTNAIFLQNRICAADVIVNTEPGTIDILQDSLSSALSLTSADRRWMDEIIEAVNDGGVNDAQTEYLGSDDYLRAKFEEYILTLLSSVKHSQNIQPDDTIDNVGSSGDRNMTADYGTYFVKAWQQTPNYDLWNNHVDWELLNEIVAPGHPCQGNFSLAHSVEGYEDRQESGTTQAIVLKGDDDKSREAVECHNSVWQEFEKLQPEENDATATFEPAIYSPRSREAPTDNGKGLIQSASTNPLQRPTARSVPDPEATSDEEQDDVVVPPQVSRRASSRTPSIQQQYPPTSSPSLSSSAPRTGSGAGSPVSNLSSTLGPATAATAALGQKAAGMFSNVSSFFQAKKKELIDAQREAEEQYQQRIHQHERKKKIMQEKARATASTFAISPKGPSSRTSSPAASSTPQQVNTTDLYAYVAPQSPVRSPTATSPRLASVSSPRTASMTAKSMEVTADSKDKDASSLNLIAPSPVVPASLSSPTLTRGDGDVGNDSAVSPEGQQAIEKELQEALETIPTSASSPPPPPPHALKVAVDSTAFVTPTRSLTPAEAYSPFSEISGPPSPADPLGASATIMPTAVESATSSLPSSSNKDTTKKEDVPLGEALPIP
ncbi:late secretory pathway protein avl9 [Gryganskiella cystojenkinii]|nr:late secretory pathway protein avl9 [Gryganskiella cystojenkinii]